VTIAVYVRVSTVSQNEEGQREEIQKWLDGHGHTAQWFVDKASGTNLDRPQFEAMQKAIFNGEVKTVVVYKLDRLSRKLRDGINVMHDWLEQGIRIVSVTQQLDFSGATGKLVAAVLLAVAEMENELRAERQRAGIEAAKKRGVYKGRKRGVVKKIDPVRVQALREKGCSWREIGRMLEMSDRSIRRQMADAGFSPPSSTSEPSTSETEGSEAR